MSPAYWMPSPPPWNAATGAMVAFLKAVEIDPIEAEVTADMILNNPKRQGGSPA